MTPTKCRECESYVFVGGFECRDCGLSAHPKCLEVSGTIVISSVYPGFWILYPRFLYQHLLLLYKSLQTLFKLNPTLFLII